MIFFSYSVEVNTWMKQVLDAYLAFKGSIIRSHSVISCSTFHALSETIVIL